MKSILTQAPAVEPLDVNTVKNHLRLDADLTNDDALIAMMISAARRYAEDQTGRSFIVQKRALVGDSFPGGATAGYAQRWVGYSLPVNAALLERGPVQSVDSIVYTDMGGTVQTITSPAAPDYAIDLSDPLARITPGFGRIWPIPLPIIGSVRINYTCGYGAAATDVPESVRLWMLAAIQTCYRNRGVLIQLARGEKTEAFDFIDGMLDDVRVAMV